MNKFLRLAQRVIKLPFLRIQQLYFNMAGSRLQCNVCAQKANQFNSDGWHLYSNCPNCYSSVRQRLVIAALSLLDEFSFDLIIRGKKVLHFAPEKSSGKLLRKVAKVYSTADFLAEGYDYGKIDYNLDISDMKGIHDEAFDCVIACDVLEHVSNHLGGIREVYRILSPGGYCIFTVPQKDHLKITLEDPTITDKQGRERVFGQVDHLRIYGDDFMTMLRDSGFEVTAVDERAFEPKIVERFVLFPPVLSTRPLATNYRKVFFGKKKREPADHLRQ